MHINKNTLLALYIGVLAVAVTLVNFEYTAQRTQELQIQIEAVQFELDITKSSFETILLKYTQVLNELTSRQNTLTNVLEHNIDIFDNIKNSVRYNHQFYAHLASTYR